MNGARSSVTRRRRRRHTNLKKRRTDSTLAVFPRRLSLAPDSYLGRARDAAEAVRPEWAITPLLIAYGRQAVEQKQRRFFFFFSLSLSSPPIFRFSEQSTNMVTRTGRDRRDSHSSDSRRFEPGARTSSTASPVVLTPSSSADDLSDYPRSSGAESAQQSEFDRKSSESRVRHLDSHSDWPLSVEHNQMLTFCLAL